AEGVAFVVGPGGELVGAREKTTGTNAVPGPDGADPRHPMVTGRAPRAPGELALDRATAVSTGYGAGDRVRFVVAGETRTGVVTGVFTSDDPRLLSGGTLTLFDTASARRWFAPAPDAYTALSLTARPGVPDSDLAGQAAALLPAGLEAVDRATLDAETEAEVSAALEKITGLLLSFAAVVLLTAGFLVANAFTMLSAARAREHALLRAVGATRGYLTRLVLTEAVLVGGAAALLGHLLGMAAAVPLDRFFGAGTGGGPRLTGLMPPLVSVGVGVVVAVVSAYVPARRAASVSPVAALRTGLPQPPASLRRRSLAGAAVTVLGGLLLAAATDTADLGLLTCGGAVLLLGLILLTPLCALALVRLVRTVAGPRLGVRGRLAAENMCRNPRRTAATAASLMTGLSLVAAATMGAAALRATADAEARAAMSGDLRVVPVTYGRIADGTAERVARVPGVAAVTPRVPGELELSGGDWLSVTGVDPAAVARAAGLTVHRGSLDRLGERGIAVTRTEARERGWTLGTRVTGVFDGMSRTAAGTPGPQTLTVVALYDGPEVFSPALVASAALTAAEPAEIVIAAGPGSSGGVAGLRERIGTALDNPALLVQDRADAGREAARPVEPFLDVVHALLSLAVLIGALGVVNTMAMAVRERVREIGLLRVIGFDRRGVASVVRRESVLISLLGTGLGVFAGTLVGAAAVVGQEGAPLIVPWGWLALCFVAATAIGVLASLGPARWAARVRLLSAVQSDGE
ncbi:FtsX-like permease family protein, partial [Streptomyces clavuligerus]